MPGDLFSYPTMPTEAINPMVVIPLSAQPPPDPHENSDTESLTDAQVSSLLAAAENRLQQKESARTNSSSADAASIKASKLDAGKVVEPYIRNQGGVAKIDGRRGVGREEREAAERVRVVEKVEKGKGGKEVSLNWDFVEARCIDALNFYPTSTRISETLPCVVSDASLHHIVLCVSGNCKGSTTACSTANAHKWRNFYETPTSLFVVPLMSMMLMAGSRRIMLVLSGIISQPPTLS